MASADLPMSGKPQYEPAVRAGQ